MADSLIQVEVVYALPEQYWSVVLDLPIGSKVADAVRLADMPSRLEGAPFEPAGWAIHSRPVNEESELRDGDRLEILRGLIADPKQARRERATGTGPERG